MTNTFAEASVGLQRLFGRPRDPFQSIRTRMGNAILGEVAVHRKGCKRMAVARTPRSIWIEAGLHALAQGGPSAVRVEALAKTLGVTKGSFYWHLGDREAFLDEMLTTWEHDVTDNVIAVVESEPGDARTKLARLFTIAQSYSRPEAMAIELAIRDWARHDPAVAERLSRVDNRRMTFMRSLFAQFCSDEGDIEARCLLAFALFIGNYFITADHGARSRSEVVEAALATLIT